MPSTVVHFAFGVLLAAALLRSRLDRTAVAVVFVAVLLPDLDTFVSFAIESTHRAALHTLLLPVAAGALLYYDLRVREASVLRARYGARGVELAGVALLVFVVSGIGLDLFTPGGVNLFYPVYDQFFRFGGEIYLSTEQGFVQTFVDVETEPAPQPGGGVDVNAGQRGSTEQVHVGTGFNPTKGDAPTGVNRVFPLAYRGWSMFLMLAAVATVVAKRRLGRVAE